MNDRRLVAAGLVLCLAGVVVVYLPGTGGFPSIATTLLLIGVTVTGLVLAVSEFVGSSSDSVDFPEPECRPAYPAPGASIADSLDSVGILGHHAVAESVDESVLLDALDERTLPREQLEATLRERAIEVLTRTTGCSRAEATDRLADGSWTDDERAAAFFAGELAPALSWRHRVPGVPSPDLPFARRAHHVIAALTEMATGDHVPIQRRPDSTEPDSEYWPTDGLPLSVEAGLSRQLPVAVLVVSAIGVLTSSTGLILVATLGIALAATAQVSSPTATVTLARQASDHNPEPGEEVRITVTVRNDSEQTVADLRLVDGVPAGVEVTDGSPRFSTALRPGNAATFSYSLEAVEGRHQFEPAIVIVSDFVGATERIDTVESTGEATVLTCDFDADSGSISPRTQLTARHGRFDGDATGSGVEFDTVREYRPGDPPSRIDWRQRAKTGELSTVELLEPRRPRVVLVVDDRKPAYVAPVDGTVPAPRQAVRASVALADRLVTDRVPVGVTTVASECWIPPGGGRRHRERIAETLGESTAVGWTPPTESIAADAAAKRLVARLEADTQVVVFTPLADDGSVELCQRLDAAGPAVTVVSPDCTDSDSVEGAGGRLARWSRCSELRGVGIPVGDYRLETTTEEVIARVRSP